MKELPQQIEDIQQEIKSLKNRARDKWDKAQMRYMFATCYGYR